MDPRTRSEPSLARGRDRSAGRMLSPGGTLAPTGMLGGEAASTWASSKARSMIA